jgi:hypothetical protein
MRRGGATDKDDNRMKMWMRASFSITAFFNVLLLTDEIRMA